MNARPTAHPSVGELRAFRLGTAGPAAVAAVAAHLKGCPDCRKIVDGLANDAGADRVQPAPPTVSLPTPDPLGATRDSVSDAASFPPLDVPPELARHPDYEIQRKLGQGGMGAVYLARNKLMDRLEVLKVVNHSLLGRAGAMERFLQEIRSAARLQHPNVVTAYSASRLGDLLVLAMEYVDGPDLARLVAERGPLPVAHACHYARQVALGLQHAHEQGMVHRDIKPNNLILGRKSVVKILDFGLAKVRQEESNTGLTSANVMLGTLAYLAPEQAIDARSADIRADVYSLGCTLYYLLTGRPPFVVQNPAEAIAAHTLRQPEPVNKQRPDVPAALAAVVARMLAKDPAQRYQAPAEVADSLVPYSQREGKPPPPPEPGTTVPWPQPHRQEPDSRSRPVGAKKSRGIGRKVGLGGAVAGLLVLGIVLVSFFPGVSSNGNDQKPRPGELLTISLGAGVEMKFAWVPPGEFLMGDDTIGAARPTHRVTLPRGFYLGVVSVTQAQWQAVMNANPSFFRGADRPVEKVSWEDCQEFCRKLRQLTGQPLRLPTEAEWEYACRAGTTTAYHTGNGEAALGHAGWYGGNSGSQTHPVGKKTANDWGLHDMHGNVWQWCADWYGPYSENPLTDPTGAQFGEGRVVRGGSWGDQPEICRAADRFGYVPALRNPNCGCRVCFTLD